MIIKGALLVILLLSQVLTQSEPFPNKIMKSAIKPYPKLPNGKDSEQVSVAFFPLWGDFKKLYNITHNSASEQGRRHLYYNLIKYFIEFNFESSNTLAKVDHQWAKQFNDYIPPTTFNVSVPTFAQFKAKYNRNYRNVTEEESRMTTFTGDISTFPTLTNYSDLNDDEFEFNFMPANFIIRNDGVKMLVRNTIEVLRSKNGSSINNEPSVGYVNLQKPSRIQYLAVVPPEEDRINSSSNVNSYSNIPPNGSRLASTAAQTYMKSTPVSSVKAPLTRVQTVKPSAATTNRNPTNGIASQSRSAAQIGRTNLNSPPQANRTSAQAPRLLNPNQARRTVPQAPSYLAPAQAKKPTINPPGQTPRTVNQAVPQQRNINTAQMNRNLLGAKVQSGRLPVPQKPAVQQVRKLTPINYAQRPLASQINKNSAAPNQILPSPQVYRGVPNSTTMRQMTRAPGQNNRSSPNLISPQQYPKSTTNLKKPTNQAPRQGTPQQTLRPINTLLQRNRSTNMNISQVNRNTAQSKVPPQMKTVQTRPLSALPQIPSQASRFVSNNTRPQRVIG